MMDQSDTTHETQPPNWDNLLQQFSNSISSQSPALQLKALITFIRLFPQAPQPVLTPTIPLLINLLHQTPEPNIQQAAAYSLLLLTRKFNHTFAQMIGQSGAIPIILRLLPGSRNLHRRCLLKCISGIVTYSNLNRVILASNRGLRFVLGELLVCNDDTRKYLLEILTSLAMLIEVRREIAVNGGGLRFLVEAVSNGKMVSRTRAADVVALLGITKRVRLMLVELGALEALVGLLRDGDDFGRVVAGNALGVVCGAHIDHARQVVRSGAIPLYVELLRGSEAIGREIVEDVFCMLVVAEENVGLILEQIVRVLEGNDGLEAKCAAIDVIWDFSSYNDSVAVVIPVLIEVLRNGCLDLKENAATVIAELSYEKEHRTVMAERGVIPVLIDFSRGDSEELREFAVEILINFEEDSMFRERVSGALENPSFLAIRERLSRIQLN